MLALTSNSSDFHLENKRKVLLLVRVSGVFSPISILKILKLMTLPDGGGAPKGRRERKTGSFCREIFGFSRLSNSARQSRSPAKNSKVRPISPSAAPPQRPRQEKLSPGRAAECAGNRCVLQASSAGTGMARPLQGPAEPFWCIQCGGPVLAERINAFPTRCRAWVGASPDMPGAARDGRGPAPTWCGGTIWVHPGIGTYRFILINL